MPLNQFRGWLNKLHKTNKANKIHSIDNISVDDIPYDLLQSLVEHIKLIWIDAHLHQHKDSKQFVKIFIENLIKSRSDN
jgi:hypothetical protein